MSKVTGLDALKRAVFALAKHGESCLYLPSGGVHQCSCGLHEAQNEVGRLMDAEKALPDTQTLYKNIAVLGLQTAKQVTVWGTNGKSGNEPLRYVRLVDCETAHLQAILKTQIGYLHPEYIVIIKSILDDRGAPHANPA